MVSGHFLSRALRPRLTPVPMAGLNVSGVSAANTGNYTVVVNYINGGKSTTETQTLRLLVASEGCLQSRDNMLAWISSACALTSRLSPVAPKLDSGRLEVRHLPNATLSPLHAQLSCGQFVNLGQPPVSVTWLTPSGENTTSTSSGNGTFLLSLQNPVEGGNYTCMILPSASATCGARHGIQNVSSLLVDGTTTRLQLIEERLSALERHDNSTLKDFNSQDDLLKTLIDFNNTLNDCVQRSEFNFTDQLHQVMEATR
ncbi:hypothetical protein C0Q70_03172 [Pomacea canaliculata]|uniref:Ig-like domain-containing protein n=1 Tax=Pomacea canaliculata TaxID=400727 RepID=A0A2T7PS42_POMCA|nr:hypothetical protein C0Q70_03172 [Pomacea canaliculata]